MSEEYKDYLGDSVYAAVEDGTVKLTTENGYGPSNTIYLEQDVLAALTRYVKRLQDLSAEDKKEKKLERITTL